MLEAGRDELDIVLVMVESSLFLILSKLVVFFVAEAL